MLNVVFVCWGNICRSPMAERVAQRAAEQAGLTGVRFTSAATSTEELGSPMDARAAAVLSERGYTPTTIAPTRSPGRRSSRPTW